MHSILSSKLAAVSQILKDNKVKRAFAFGSVCTDQFNEQSDIDLLIAFEDDLDPITYGENYFNIIEKLEAILDRHVDLVTERTLRNPYFIKVMERTKTPIYE